MSGYIDQVKSSDLNSAELNTWITNQSFYGIVPINNFIYYNRVIKMFDYWTTTFDPMFHNSKIAPTRFANSLCKIEADTVFGQDLIFKSKTPSQELFLDGVKKWSEYTKFPQTVKSAFYESARFGTSLLKINKSRDYGYYVECVPMNRFWCTTDVLGKVISADMFIDTFTFANNCYMLFEERRTIKGKPFVKYSIYRTEAEMGKTFTRSYCGYVPSAVMCYFRDKYGIEKNGQVAEINGDYIQCYLIKWSDKNPQVQSVAFGESALSDIMVDLQLYDIINSQIAVELYLGKPRALLPLTMARTAQPTRKITKSDGKVEGGTLNTDVLSDMAVFNSQKQYVGLDPTMYDIIPNMSTDSQKPEFFQATLQSDKLTMLRDNVIKNIAMKRQYSVRLLENTMGTTSGNVTATQITAEEAPTLNFINKKLFNILPVLNEIVKEVMILSGKPSDIEVEMNNVNSRNMISYLQELQIKKMEGWESDEAIIRNLHPEFTENQIAEILAQNKKKEQMYDETRINGTL